MMVGLATMLVLLGQAPGAAEFQGVTYVNAAGWAEQNQPEVRTLVAPSSQPGEFAVLMIFAARAASADPAADLQAFADQAEHQGRTLMRGGIERKRFGPYTALMMPARAELPSLGQHSRIYELVTDAQTSALVVALYRGEATFAANRATLLQVMASVKPGAGAGVVRGPPVPASAAREAPPAPAGGTSSGGIPYADTKALVFTKGFRPSGRGVPIPRATLASGVPVGLWWNAHVASASSSIHTTVFLPDRTIVRYFRPGGPALVDLDGMRALGDQPYIGRYEVEGGVMTATYGEYRVSKPITLHSTSEGPFFIWNHEEYHPAMPLSRQAVVGTWRLGAVGTYTFRQDGTVITTPPMIDATFSHASIKEQLVGTWALDGYLLALQFPVDGARVFYAFHDDQGGLVIGQSHLVRE
jgi:hypothetical protein